MDGKNMLVLGMQKMVLVGLSSLGFPHHSETLYQSVIPACHQLPHVKHLTWQVIPAPSRCNG